MKNKFKIFLVIILSALLFVFGCSTCVKKEPESAKAFMVEEFTPESYYLVFPADTVFVSVGNWSSANYYTLVFTLPQTFVSFPVFVNDGSGIGSGVVNGVDNFMLYRSNSISPPEYSLTYDFYYPISANVGEYFINYSGQLGIQIYIGDYGDNIVLSSKTTVYPLIVKYNALTDSELNTIYNNGYIDGEQNASNEYYQIGYEEGYQGGYDRGAADGYEQAVNEDLNGIGIFYGAVAFVRMFFTMATTFFSTEIAGDLTIGLFVIIIPTTILIINLIIGLVKKFLGGRGAKDGDEES